MKQQLVVSAIGPDNLGLVNHVSKAIFEAGGSIDDSRMMVLGGEFGIILKLSADSEQLDDLEAAIHTALEEINLSGVIKRTTETHYEAKTVPYVVEAIAMDDTGIVHQVSHFFDHHKVNIENLVTDVFSAPLSGTPMFSLKMVIDINDQHDIGKIKDAFSDLANELDMDGSIELLTDSH